MIARALVTTLLVSLVASGCGGSGRHQTATLTTSALARTLTVSQTRTSAPPSKPAPVPRPRPKPRPDPGSLPQTDQLPSAHSAAFHVVMRALWRAIVTGRASLGRPAFFPEGAYAQVKAIADPTADYRDRLVSDFALDVAAAHRLLGRGPVRLAAVDVPASFAHWVGPGVCDNRVGYYELPNARLVYDRGGQTRSFGIASMISWRGVWYVVHLGAVVRSGAGGLIDDPQPGPGRPTPSSTC